MDGTVMQQDGKFVVLNEQPTLLRFASAGAARWPPPATRAKNQRVSALIGSSKDGPQKHQAPQAIT